MSKKPGRPSPLAALEKAERRRKWTIAAAIGVILVALVAAIGVSAAVHYARSTDPGPTPAAVTENGAITVGNPNAPTTVRIVADLQCPACQVFETKYGTPLNNAVSAGKIKLEYNLAAFLDRSSTTNYSSRAANAAYCLSSVDNDPSHFLPWVQAMYEKQPPEGGAGLPDNTMLDLAATAGYQRDKIADCVSSRKYRKYVQAKTQALLQSGISSTPTVFLNGKKIDQDQLQPTMDGVLG